MLREQGIDPDKIISGVGLNLALFGDSENTIEYATVGRLLNRCELRTRCPYFGLLLGKRSGLDCLGVLGSLLQCLPTVGSALHSLVSHLHIHDRGGVLELSIEQDVAVLSYLIYQQVTEGSNHIDDGAIAIAFNVMQALCGPTWRPIEVLFAHRPPNNSVPYSDFFKAPLRFDVERTALVFPATWLDNAIADADLTLSLQFEQRITALEAMNNRDLVCQLRRALRTILITHRSTLGQVAQLLSVHSRTLNRRLQTQGCTFQGLMDEVRYEIARQLLENTRMPMSQIAVTLDYSEPSAFSRAFQRWSGTTPTKWRSRAKPESCREAAGEGISFSAFEQ